VAYALPTAVPFPLIAAKRRLQDAIDVFPQSRAANINISLPSCLPRRKNSEIFTALHGSPVLTEAKDPTNVGPRETLPSRFLRLERTEQLMFSIHPN
jgi:hypothetical protein